MSRTKKSRKPISEPTKKPKLSKKELESVEKRVRKKKGKQAGNRQKEAKPLEQVSENNSANRDPRIGSKKPIDLGGVKVANTKPSKAKNVQHKAPIAPIRSIEPAETNYAAELEAIEDNPQLQAIIAKQESGEDLSDQEVDFYNQQMTRYDELRDILGLDDEDDFDEEIEGSLKSEDDLWDTLDKPKFEDFD
ncbi:MAG: Der GTPase-activating protein YihI [Colwellia sp.]